MTATFSPVVLFHQAAGAFLLPPLCFIWLALFGLWRKRRSLVLLALLCSYLLATPQMALWLSAPLEPPVLAADAPLASYGAIVVLGGGTHWSAEYGSVQLGGESLARVRYAAMLARRSGKPVLLSGGAPLGGPPEARVMQQTLLGDYGLQARWLDPLSNTTAENARQSARLLQPSGIHRILLVSSAWHLRRASADFRAQGFDVTPAPTSFVRYDLPRVLLFVPRAQAMQQTATALREWLALLVYRQPG